MFYSRQYILWHLKQKIPYQEISKIRWTRPHLVKKVYNNGFVNVTTLQNQKLKRINMNKIKPYYELEVIKAYALQALIIWIFEERVEEEKKTNEEETLLYN